MGRTNRFNNQEIVFLETVKQFVTDFYGKDRKLKRQDFIKITCDYLSLSGELPNSLSFNEDDISFFYTHRKKTAHLKRVESLKRIVPSLNELSVTTLNLLMSLMDSLKVIGVEQKQQISSNEKVVQVEEEGSKHFVRQEERTWTLVATSRGVKNKISILCVIEFESNSIINHLTSECEFAPSDIIKLLKVTIQTNEVPSIVAIPLNGDRRLSDSPMYTDFQKEYNIILHFTESSQSQSQFEVDFWRSIGIEPHSSVTLQAWEHLEISKRKEFMNHIIRFYNYNYFQGINPIRRLEDLIRCETVKYINKRVIENPGLAEMIEQFHYWTLLSYQGDYIQALIENLFNTSNTTALSLLYNDNDLDINNKIKKQFDTQTVLITTILSEGLLFLADQMKKQKEILFEQNQTIEGLSLELSEVNKYTKKLYDDQTQKELLREKRQSRKKQKSRDACTFEIYTKVLSYVYSPSPVVAARDRVAFTLLFMTGIRISNLKNIYYHHLESLLAREDITITLIKTRKETVTQTFPWQSAYAELLKRIEKDLRFLLQTRNLNDESPFSQSREYLTRRLNKQLKRISFETGKYFRSHSFRINIGTKVTETHGIVAAQKILGHQSINTTMRYNRSGLTKRQSAEILRDALNVDIKMGESNSHILT